MKKYLIFIVFLFCAMHGQSQSVSGRYAFTGDANNCQAIPSCTLTLGFTVTAGDIVFACWTPEGSNGFGYGYGLNGGETWIEAPSPPTTALNNGGTISPVSVTAWAANSAITTTGSTSGSSVTMTVGSGTGILYGQVVTGTNIAAGTIVAAVSGTTVTLSPASTGTVSGTVTFSSVHFTGTNSYYVGEILKLSNFTTTTAFNGEGFNVVIARTSSTFDVGNIQTGSGTETGTANIEYPQQLMQAGHYYWNQCYYTLNAVGGETSLTVKWKGQTTANQTNASFFVFDYTVSGGTYTPSYDANQMVAYSVSGSYCAGCSVGALTVSGTYDVCMQLAEYNSTWSTGSSPAPYTERENDSTAGNTAFDKTSNTGGTCPSYTSTQTSSGPALFSSWAFSLASAGAHAIPVVMGDE
jgi:hypothetical protein